jgi:dolichol-phosphate hexosyltransferase
MTLQLPTRPDPARVTILIPAKDEAAAIGDTLRSLPLSTLALEGFKAEILILDGNSRDGTRDIAYQTGRGATIIFDREEGKGAALRNARPLISGSYAIMLDADGTYAADAIPRVLDPLARGVADVVMGDRQAQQGALTGSHRIGNALLSMAARILYERKCPDVCTGLWGFRTQVLRELPLRSKGFDIEAEMFALSVRRGLRITHVPVDYLPRRGTPKLSTADGVRIGWRLLLSRVTEIQPALPSPSPSMPHSVTTGRDEEEDA